MSMILSSLIIIPLIGAIIALFMGGSREKLSKYVAIAFSAITLVVSLLLLLGIFGDFEDLSESFEWIHNSSFIMNYALTVDGLSILMVFLTALLVLLVNIFSLDEHRENNNYFYALIMAMEVGLMGVYLASDYFLFYIMWEVTLIPMYFMISWYGGPRRHYSAIKFFIYTHVASLVMLIGFFVIGYESVAPGEVVNFSFEAVKNGIASAALGIQSLIFALLFFGFMVKMPSVPFHTWLPDAHTEAPTEGSVLLAGVMLKMGSYGIIRICVEALPDAAAYWQWVIIAIAIVSIIYGAYGWCGAEQPGVEGAGASHGSAAGHERHGRDTVQRYPLAACASLWDRVEVRGAEPEPVSGRPVSYSRVSIS